MAANTTPIFTLTPNVGMARLSGATASRDMSSTTNSQCVFTAQTNGSRVDSVTFTSAQSTAAANSAMVCRLFVNPNTTPTFYFLIAEVALAATTASSTAVGATQTVTFVGGLVIPNGYKLFATQSVNAGQQDNVDVISRGGDF